MSNQRTDRYVVIGNPVAHSKSPLIHRHFARQTGQDMSYETLLAPLDGFVKTADEFRRQGGKGANVTVPFKQEAWHYADELSQRAQRAGAVNTLAFRADGTVAGDNTDGVGLVTDLTRNHHVALQNKNILLLGAGGAVRGVLAPLLAAQPAALTIANRTVEKAVELATLVSDLGSVSGCGFDALVGQQYDVIVNGTAASLQGDVPPLPDNIVASGGCCYDMMYANEPTAYMQWAGTHGAALVLDGLGMLVEQAAESFYIWRGVRPVTADVIDAVRNS
jgi:shikimate dehydrogenase